MRQLLLLCALVCAAGLPALAQEKRPNHFYEFDFGMRDGGYAEKNYGISLFDSYGNDELRFTDRASLKTVRNGSESMIERYDTMALMLGLKAGNNSFMTALRAASERREDLFRDSYYLVGWNYTFKISSDFTIEPGILLSNEFSYWDYFGFNENIPGIIPLVSLTWKKPRYTVKAGVFNMFHYRTSSIEFMVRYIPVYEAAVSLKYNLSKGLYLEAFADSHLDTVDTSEVAEDKLCVLTTRTGLRAGTYLSSNIGISADGGYSPLQSEWEGTALEQKGEVKRLNGSWFANLKVSLFF